MKLLIVEDDNDLSDMYAAALTSVGHKVAIAHNAQAALDFLENNKVGLLLLDLLLPGHNGMNVLHELRTYNDWRILPVIILSNLSREDTGISAKHLQELGVTSYLVKSQTKPHELVHAVAKASEINRANI